MILNELKAPGIRVELRCGQIMLLVKQQHYEAGIILGFNSGIHLMNRRESQFREIEWVKNMSTREFPDDSVNYVFSVTGVDTGKEQLRVITLAKTPEKGKIIVSMLIVPETTTPSGLKFEDGYRFEVTAEELMQFFTLAEALV